MGKTVWGVDKLKVNLKTTFKFHISRKNIWKFRILGNFYDFWKFLKIALIKNFKLQKTLENSEKCYTSNAQIPVSTNAISHALWTSMRMLNYSIVPNIAVNWPRFNIFNGYKNEPFDSSQRKKSEKSKTWLTFF